MCRGLCLESIDLQPEDGREGGLFRRQVNHGEYEGPGIVHKEAEKISPQSAVIGSPFLPSGAVKYYHEKGVKLPPADRE